MYAEIPDDLIETKACLFEIGEVYLIKKFVVQDSRRNYRAVHCDLRIDITEYTTAELISNPSRNIPHYVYRLTPFHAIKVTRAVFNYTGYYDTLPIFDKLFPHRVLSLNSNITPGFICRCYWISCQI